jgi:polysaccharide export outer membrane protein
MHSFLRPAIAAATALLVAGCAELPGVGPITADVVHAAGAPADGGARVQIVDLDAAVARRLNEHHHQSPFSEALGAGAPPEERIGAGDTLQITIWEAPPATLFNAAPIAPAGTPTTTQPAALPEQGVETDGGITVPFAGRITAAGKTPRALGEEIGKRLAGKANHPEVLVRVTRNASSMVTVVGEVNTSVRMPLTASGEHLLDALATAGGTRQPVNKMTIQLTRGDHWYVVPLDRVIRDPKQNVRLQSGDVVTALYQPLSFTAFGATGRQDEINFEAQGVTLAQALARANGLQDNKAHAQGVFVFRLEPADALDWPDVPVAATPEGLVPVIYRVDLRDPRSFFTMQNFAMNDHDILYVSNAPAAELQKFLNILFSATYPLLQLTNAINR